MSILIKGVKMPTTCEDCPCFYPKYNECNAIVGRWVDGKGTPPSDCPLVPVPPHGRLIDADALLNDKGVGIQIAGWGKMFHKSVVEYAPTIIEEER